MFNNIFAVSPKWPYTTLVLHKALELQRCKRMFYPEITMARTLWVRWGVNDNRTVWASCTKTCYFASEMKALTDHKTTEDTNLLLSNAVAEPETTLPTGSEFHPNPVRCDLRQTSQREDQAKSEQQIVSFKTS